MTNHKKSSRRTRKRRGTRSSSDVTNGTTIYKMVQGPVHRFVRYLNAGELSKTAADQGFATVFALNFLPNSSDFTSLFDQYRIDKVEQVFEMDIADGTLNSTTRWPRITICPDFNNQAAPLSEDAILSYEQARQYQFSTSERRFSVILRPQIASTVYRTGVTSAYEMKPSGWLDVATNDVPHYGLRYWIANYNTTSFGASNVRVYVRYWLSFRNAS